MAGCQEMIIKVCGITRQEDATACEKRGAKMLGFIFHPESPRYIEPEAAGAIETENVLRVGVFVNQTVEEVRKIMRAAELNLAQLSGGQDVEFCERLGRMKVMRVFWPERYASVAEFQADLDTYRHCSRFYLFDAGKSGGGHGRPMDYSKMDGIKPDKSYLMAGGISPETIVDLLANVTPCGVDLNSGVETAPGVKDMDLLEGVLRHICPQH